MCEKLCALLLRLYPAEFRDAYGPDALQLMRDRARDERGLVLRIRLIVDLLRDLLAISLSGYSLSTPVLMPAADGDVRVPTFHIIEQRGPKPAALAAGMLASTLMLATFTLLFQARHFAEPPARLGDIADAESTAEATGAESDDATEAAGGTGSNLRQALVRAVAARLRERYVDRAIGQQLAYAVVAAERNGVYNAALMNAEIAARITTTIHDTSRALGVPAGTYVADLVYSERPIPEGPPPPRTPEMREQYRSAMVQQNCLFAKTETLPRNIGYVKVNGFADPAACRETTTRVMTSMNTVDALIVDLRDNAGGYGEAVLQMAGYLFGRPTAFFDPRARLRDEPPLTSPVAGSTLAGKPVYVLTSAATQSAAEYFTYNLKMLKRATIVGERTAGRQHSGAFHRLNNHFGMGIQQNRLPQNPFPVKGWEVIGVEPDVKASKTDALETAIKLLQRR